jgi:hypothetical protein
VTLCDLVLLPRTDGLVIMWCLVLCALLVFHSVSINLFACCVCQSVRCVVLLLLVE